MSRPELSIVIPCFNEEKSIFACITSLLDNEISDDSWEILIVDGMSEDRTRSEIERASVKHDFIRVLDNPERIKPIALNRGIGEARGKFVMRIDAHSTYMPGYVDLLLSEIRRGEVQNVGGVQIADKSGLRTWGLAIAIAVSHPIAMGNAVHRFQGQNGPRFVDTVFCGCYPKTVFDEIGLFNEQLIRTQDREFNERLLLSGGKILLLQNVTAHYRPRTDLWKYIGWTYHGARWLFKARHYTRVTMTRIRNFVPLIFVTYILAAVIAALALTSVLSKIVFFAPLVIYATILFVESIRQAIVERTALLIICFPVVVAATHFAYGIGSLVGLAAGKEK